MARRIMVLGTVLALGFAAAPLTANAETAWQKNHPRRAEVNRRLNNQRKRINQGVGNGRLTPQQAGQLHREDHQIRHEERSMASQDGGHITKQEQRTLNQQENKVSQQIYDEKHPK